MIDNLLAELIAAIGAEIAASGRDTSAVTLHLDGIESVAVSAGRYQYRLILSGTMNFNADQPLTFRSRKGDASIQATVVKSDDSGVVVETQEALPADAALLLVQFDPAFILTALRDFFTEATATGAVTRQFLTRAIPPTPAVTATSLAKLTDEQALAVAEMTAVPIHLLWGPPGTGKTTTVGAAVAGWARDGKKVLVVSTSNAAVDVALRACRKRLAEQERPWILRLGTSLDPIIQRHTANGKLAARDDDRSDEIVAAQERLQEIQEQLRNRNSSNDRRRELFDEERGLEAEVEHFNEDAARLAPELTRGIRVWGCTLARMVLDKSLRESAFDFVVLDEASMASLAYALAATFFAESTVVFAGDPKQLPPIVRAASPAAQKWFGSNVYDWYDIREPDEAAAGVRMLRTQFRMTDEIGGLVSRLSYRDLLHHGRQTSGPAVEFIDLDPEWRTTHYSVSEKSYYHLASVALLHAILPTLESDDVLLLTPFRPQRSLLAAVAFDLRSARPKRRIAASTIHKAQGSESDTVVVDLTTHSAESLVAFFRDRHSEQLLNVAMSRAKNRLIVIGNRAVVELLAQTGSYWQRLLRELGRGITVTSAASTLGALPTYADIGSLPLVGASDQPALFSARERRAERNAGSRRLRELPASVRLMVRSNVTSVGDGNYIVRKSTDSPTVFLAGGRICLPLGDRWCSLPSPNACRVVWRIGFSHLADEEIDPARLRRFFCPMCPNGDLLIRRLATGYHLECTNASLFTCHHRPRLGEADAKLKVRSLGRTCPSGHPMTVRRGGSDFFLGCENYPHCEHTEPMSVMIGL